MTTMPKPKRANSRAAVLGTKQADLRRDIATRFSADRQPGPERRSGGPPIGTGAKVPYSDELGARICAMLTAGYSLSEIAAFKGMPAAHAIRHWACWPEKYPVFASAYSRARAAYAEALVERIVEVAEQATDRDSAQAARVQIDAYKWVASKLHPARYGDQLALQIGGAASVAPVSAAAPEWLGRAIGTALGSALAALQESAEPQPLVIEAGEAPQQLPKS